jgi:hypothetical protein
MLLGLSSIEPVGTKACVNSLELGAAMGAGKGDHGQVSDLGAARTDEVEDKSTIFARRRADARTLAVY